MDIPLELNGEIKNYCQLNNITNMDKFMVDMIIQGLNIEKYGNSPIQPQTIEKEIIKEVQVIKEVEVYVEKIVEKVVEVPVEKIVEVIKEVPVEKIVEKIITDDTQVQELVLKIRNLENELESGKINNLKEIGDREKDLTNKITLLEKDLELEKIKTANSSLTKLYDEVNNLKALLEIERNRNKSKKEQDNPFGNKPKSSISWVPKENRDNSLYGE